MFQQVSVSKISSFAKGSLRDAGVFSKKDGLDYSPYGTLLHHRHGTQTGSDSYRYAFQGQEKDDEIKGEGNSYSYKYRMHDPRIGRFFAVDPLTAKYPELTPYQFSSNSPIYMVELEGLEGDINIGPGSWFIWTTNGAAIEIQNSLEVYVKTTVVIGSAAIAVGMVVEAGVVTVLKEVGEELVEEVTGVPMITDGFDVLQQIYKKGGRKFASDIIVEGRKFAKGASISSMKRWAWNVKEYGKYAAEKLKSGWSIKQAENHVHNASLYGDDLAEKYAEGKIFREDMVAGGLCFVSGTKIKVLEGQKNIEEIAIGDIVWSFNEKTQKIELDKVISVFRKDSVVALVKLFLGEEEIYTTEDHPFYCNNHWVKAGDLKVGDTLYSSFLTKNDPVISRVQYIDTVVTVYNFKVANNHNYFVSRSEILVHNNNCSHGNGSAKGALTDDLIEGLELDGSYEFDGTMADFKVFWIKNTSGVKDYGMSAITQRFEELARTAGKKEVQIRFTYVLNDRLKKDAGWAAEYGFEFKYIPSETGEGTVVWSKKLDWFRE